MVLTKKWHIFGAISLFGAVYFFGGLGSKIVQEIII